MREETLRSMVRSPTSTTSPPTMSGLTWVMLISTHDRYISDSKGAHVIGDLKLLALADVGRLGNSSLEPVESLVVKGLCSISVSCRRCLLIASRILFRLFSDIPERR